MKSLIKNALLTVSLASCLISTASDRKLHNVYSRDNQSLNGAWQIIIDPFDAGYYDYRLKPSSNGYFKNAQPRNGFDHVEYDFSDVETLQVPGDWNTQDPSLIYYEGSIWYKRDFKHAKKDGERAYLYFGGSNYQTDVYLNGEKLGTHIGGFTPFNYDITDRVNDGDNFVVCRVNNRRLPEAVPTVNSDWWNYGGITRDVMVVTTPDVSVDDYSVRLADGVYDRVDLSVSISQPVAGREVVVNIPDLKIKQKLVTDENGRAAAVVKAKPQLWSPELPTLYDVEIVNDGETIKDRIGFRHIAREGKQILLNGKPVFLCGISIHEEAPYRTGRCRGIEDDQILLDWAKELGCNFIRLAHYPHNEAMVRRAEEMGLMVWSEIPVYWTIHWDNPETLANAKQQLADNMDRDHNRAAVVIWSLANETPHSEARDAFLSNLAQQVRERDTERLISMAMEVSGSSNNVSHVHDSMNPYVDIVSFNNYLGWYGGRPDDCDTRVFDIPYDKPFFVSEFGGGAVAGLHGSVDEKWTEEYQANLYDKTLKMYDRHEGWVGCSPWILMDFRSPRRQNHKTQQFFNRKGIISEKGQKKAAFDVLHNFYSTKQSK